MSPLRLNTIARLFLCSGLFVGTSAFAESVILHAWLGKAYTNTNKVREAEWNPTLNAYVVSQDLSKELAEEFPGQSIYANSHSFCGWIGGCVFKWQYRVVGEASVQRAEEEGLSFPGIDPTEQEQFSPTHVCDILSGQEISEEIELLQEKLDDRLTKGEVEELKQIIAAIELDTKDLIDLSYLGWRRIELFNGRYVLRVRINVNGRGAVLFNVKDKPGRVVPSLRLGSTL